MNFVNIIYKRQIKDFNIIMKDKCKEWNILATMPYFLNYKKNDFCSPAYQYLFNCNKQYLVASKSFKYYWNSLDIDFKNDLMTANEFNSLRFTLRDNKSLYKFIKKQLKDDFDL